MPEKLLIINPGSTSTKIAVFDGDRKLFEQNVSHAREELARYENVADQYQFRVEAITEWLESIKFEPSDADAFVGRGAPLRPLEGGSYKITEQMLSDLKNAAYSNHASNLGAIIARQFGDRYSKPSLISDPVTVDNFTDIARLSGLPEIERKCRVHALNIKEVCRRLAAGTGRKLDELNFVAVHMGGGISVAALEGGRVVDVNDALLGMGPFSPDRAGALPIGDLVKLCYSGNFSEKEMLDKLSRRSGLIAYVGESDLRKVEGLIGQGDIQAELCFRAMAYQISKEIGQAAVALRGEFESIVLTGGMAHSKRLSDLISGFVGFLGKIVVVPGEFEMEALAAAGLRFLRGEDELKLY